MRKQLDSAQVGVLSFKEYLHHWQWILIVVLLAILVRVTYFVVTVPYNPVAQDRDLYLHIARHLVAGRGYSMGPSPEKAVITTIRGPVSVYFFAAVVQLFGDHTLSIAAANWIVDGITAALIYLVALELVDEKSMAFVAALLFGIYVPEAFYAWQALSEPFFTMLLAAFVLVWLRALRTTSIGRFAAGGLLLGLATLSRPILQYFVPVSVVMGIWLLRRYGRRAVNWAVVMATVFVAVMTPWTVRNYIVFGDLIPVSSYMGHNLYATHYTLGKDDYLRPRDFLEDFTVYYDQLLQQRLGPDYKSFTTQPERDAMAKKEAVAIIKQYPLRYIILSIVRFFRLWYYVYGASVHGTSSPLVTYIMVLVNGGLWLLAAWAAIRYRGPWVGKGMPLFGLVLYYALGHAAIHVQVRYAMPVVPYVMVVAAIAIVYSWADIRSFLRPRTPRLRLGTG